MIFLRTFHNWKKLSAKEMNWLKIVWCKGHRRKEKIYDRRTLQSILWRRTYSRRVGVWKDLGPGMTFVSDDLPRWTSARRAPSVRPLQCSRASLKRFALLTLVALWPTSVRLLPSSISLWSTVRTVILRLCHPAELVFLQMGQMGWRFGGQGFSPSKRKVGAQLGAPVMVGLSVLGVIRTSQNASLYFRSGGSGCVDRSWTGHALLFVCFYVSFHVFCFSLIRAVASLLCSCLAVFLVTLLLALCDYNFYLLESPKRV